MVNHPNRSKVFTYRVCWENQHAERFYSDETTNSTDAMRLGKHCVRDGRLEVRILIALAKD